MPIIHSMLSAGRIPPAFLRNIVSYSDETNQGGWKMEACDLFFILSISSHASAVTQFVAVDPTLSVGLSGSRHMGLDWNLMGKKKTFL